MPKQMSGIISGIRLSEPLGNSPGRDFSFIGRKGMKLIGLSFALRSSRAYFSKEGLRAGAEQHDPGPLPVNAKTTTSGPEKSDRGRCFCICSKPFPGCAPFAIS
ncbi:hypothetical protein KG007_13590 [Alistipes sp. kh20]|uniref:hypothetical protein n=1 Tax=Alistipes montrealensis TaxID=2834113 RepID=UPI001BD0CFDF|nr:hypothetical protein [Alistipes montrealensis]MBS4767231.1 hypothetical protein [Alistipes montrealensis]